MAGVENNEINSVVGQEEHHQYPVAYHPIPRFVIKEEPQSDEDQDERSEQMQHLKSYPPLPHGEIKEELEIGEDRVEFIFNGEQVLMTQQCRNRDKSNQEPAAESGSAVRESSEDDGSGYGKGGERSEHSSLQDLDESDNSLSVDSTDVMFTRVAIQMKQISPIIEKTSTRQAKRRCRTFSIRADAIHTVSITIEEDFLPSPKAGPSKEPARQVRKATHRKKREDGSHHTAPKKRFTCSKCERSYQRKDSLTAHLKNECGVEPRFTCTHCDRQFKRKDNLRKHLIIVHKIDRKQLDKHGAGFQERQEMPFKCPKCDSSYKQKRTLDQHIKYECGVAFNCSLCKQNFTKKSSLRKHLLVVHNVALRMLDKYGAGYKVRPIHPFKCDQCGRTYTRKSNLTRHLTGECGVEPSFSCPKCDCRCKQKSKLKLHLIEIHNVEPSQLTALGLGRVVRPKPEIKCDRCGTSYMHKQSLRRHLVKKCGRQ